jgi:hypothetical protein
MCEINSSLFIALRYSTVLLKLAPGQEVSFEFIARRGIGKVSAAMRRVNSVQPQQQLTCFIDAREMVARRHCSVQIRSRR